MKRVLCILSSMNAGGAETFLMKIYRCLDRYSYQMDFCINTTEKCFYEEEIQELGGKVFRIPNKSANLIGFKEALSEIIKGNKYSTVLRITSSAAGFLDCKVSREAGATRCCVRSSNSSDGKTIKAKIAHRLGRLLYRGYVDVMIAPSDKAAIYTFGGKAWKNGLVNILHNGIDVNIFKFSSESRDIIRTEFGIEPSQFVIGHVGRFYEQKNHKYLISVYEEVVKRNRDCKLLLVGKGPLLPSIKEMVSRKGLDDSVIFAGERDDVPAIMSAIDVFVMPSLYEGMPNTVIEAQAAGLHCILADTITKEANITGLVNYLPLTNPADWATNILKNVGAKREITDQFFKNARYDIQSTTQDFIRIVFGD